MTTHAGTGDEAYARAILVRGARVNNLRGIDVDIPKRRLVVFTGVSGSGKSSLAFDTIAAESRRMLTETFPVFVQALMPHHPRPDVDELRHLSASIVVTQSPMSADPRSTVGTATDAVGLLRALYARHGTPSVPSARALSFNSPACACPACDGTGQQATLDVDRVLDGSRSLNAGAITFPNFAVGSLFWKVYARSGHFDVDRPVGDYPADQRAMLLTGSGPSVDTGSHPMAYEGVLTKIRRLYLSKDADSLPPRVRAALAGAAAIGPCPDCAGTRLDAAARGCRLAGRGIADACALQADDLAAWLAGLDLPAGDGALRARLVALLAGMGEVGLGHLSLDRRTGTLSGGEAQRIRTVLHLGSSLTELTYVFDEPAAGLHPHDTGRLIRLLHRLRDKGNTVLVVEHQPDVIRAADHLVDLGPGAGSDGGRVVFQGSPAELAGADTVTARCLARRQPVTTTPRAPSGVLRVAGATRHNLRGVTVDVPLGCLVAVTGVAGAGKTSLLASLPRTPGLVVVDQTPIRGSRRSSPATYTGALDDIRAQFAAANAVPATLFSPNSAGGCPDCAGLGSTVVTTALGETVTTTCETCRGRRFHDDVLRHTLHGTTIAELLDLPVAGAAALLAGSPAGDVLARVADVGLGYLPLGQPLTGLSGGERQRLRLAIEIGRAATVYVLDEPTTGLHLADVHRLVRVFHDLVDAGAGVVVADHHRDLVARADWVIDLGPDAGHRGGTVVFAGTPAELRDADTHTGRALRATHE